MSQPDNRINLVVVGQGKLANAIISTLPELDRNSGIFNNIQTYGDQTNLATPAIIVHVGSGRQYQECLTMALKHRCIFIQAATEKDIPMKPPTPGEIIFINAPNLDLRLIKLFYWLKLGSDLFQQDEITITESHQATKTSIPGTAYRMCDILGIDHSNVASIRDPDLQRELQIKTLDQHAYHQLLIGSGESQIKIETKIEGSASYVKGLYEILNSIPKTPVRNYEVEELLVKGTI